MIGRPTQAVILAGGRGSRLGALTESRPKPMVELHGRPFLEYLVEMLREQGFSEVLLLLGYLADVVQGVSTRAAQALHRACRARAFVHGRDFVVPDDVRALLLPVWGHRLTTRSGGPADAVLHGVLADTPMPE